jgi:hypothetical protein
LKSDLSILAEGFTITYEFNLPTGDKEVFTLRFDRQNTLIASRHKEKKLFWTRLEFEQCPHCPLTAEAHPECPVALNLVPAIESFNRLASFSDIEVKMISAERNIVHDTSVQEGIRSLMGLLIAGSSCPLTHFFKPMARFHLPFASREETMWRAAGTFLLCRYFSRPNLTLDDIQLKGLPEIYDSVMRLNDAMVRRLRAAASTDSIVNALAGWNLFAKFLSSPQNTSLTELQSIFEPFITAIRPPTSQVLSDER